MSRDATMPPSDGGWGPKAPESEDGPFLEEISEDARQMMADIREQLLGVPAEVVVTNHAMGLYELAAIHLSHEPPHMDDARLAVDALACLVEGLGDRLGEHADTLRAALANIRLVFVRRS